MPTTSNLAGSCTMLEALVHSQGVAEIEGDMEFVLRFRCVEAAEPGLSIEELSQRRGGDKALYEKLWGSMGSN